MNVRPYIQPRFILPAVALVAVLMIGTALIELRQSREELYHIMRDEALSLAESIDRSAANAILSMETVEELLAARLLNNAYYLARLDSAGQLRPADLAGIARANGLYRVNIFDRRGNKVMSNVAPDPEHDALPSRYSPKDVLAPILSGSVDQIVIGNKEARKEEGQRFAVAVRRTGTAGGAIVVNIDAAELLQFRRSMGIGTLIRNLGDNSGIAYIALQDDEGIIAASGAVRELSSVANDDALRQSIASDTTLTRIVDFGGTEVFEVLRPFRQERQLVGIFRIALAMDEVHSAEARMTRRMLILSLVVITLGALAVTFIMSQQNYRAIQKKYAAITTFTGKILEQMRDGVATVDAAGRVSIFNARAAELFGSEPKSIEGLSLEAIPQDPARYLRAILARPDGTTEMQIDRPDGTQRIVAVSLSTTHDAAGALESRTAVLRDLTDARRMEREAQRRDKLTAMGELASGVAHEIRNPLNAIAMIAQRFEKEFTPRKGAQEYRALTRVMQEEARRVNGIIRQFLSFARPPKLDRRPVPVHELLTHVASLVSGQAAEAGIALSVSAGDSAAASLDPEQMKQALLNIVQNAIEATPRGGKIFLAGSMVNGSVRFTVSDTGKGIPSEGLDKIFNLYYTTKADGTGLGLSITQQVVAQHGGTIDVASTEGEGTSITIDIPPA